METITLGQIAVALAFLAGIVASIEFFAIRVTRKLKGTIQTEMKPLSDKIGTLEMDSTKNFLVSILSRAEKEEIDEITKQRFYEEFAHYEKLKGNGYIHAWYEKLKKQERI